MSPSVEKKLIRVGSYSMTGKVLGKGHFARVEEAVHIFLNYKVAVKIIKAHEITDSYVKRNLKREPLILSKISHPNVISLLETIQTQKNYYLITEIGSGGDLCTYVKSQRYGRLDEKRSRPLARQLVSAISHLHDRGVVHRDLKMENILLDETKENVKIVDFGLSNICKMNELLRTHCGSPEYAAPELYISGRRYGPEVDIWSLGVVFYGMMVGRLPFTAVFKVGANRQANRAHLIKVTRNGLIAKHHKALQAHSQLFQNLLRKMLNPNASERITIQQLQSDSWIYGHYIPTYPQIDNGWHKKTIENISTIFDVPLIEISKMISKAPYGQFGGIYNIEKLKYIIKNMNSTSSLCSLPRIQLKSIEGNSIKPLSTSIKTHNSNMVSNNGLRPLTCEERDHTLQRIYQIGDGYKLRPKTSEMQGETANDLTATTNFRTKNFSACDGAPWKISNAHVPPSDGDNNTYLYEATTTVKNTTKKDSSSTSSKIITYLNKKFSKRFQQAKRTEDNSHELLTTNEHSNAFSSKSSSLMPVVDAVISTNYSEHRKTTKKNALSNHVSNIPAKVMIKSPIHRKSFADKLHKSFKSSSSSSTIYEGKGRSDLRTCWETQASRITLIKELLASKNETPEEKTRSHQKKRTNNCVKAKRSSQANTKFVAANISSGKLQSPTCRLEEQFLNQTERTEFSKNTGKIVDDRAAMAGAYPTYCNKCLTGHSPKCHNDRRRKCSTLGVPMHSAARAVLRKEWMFKIKEKQFSFKDMKHS